jgi:hypothetical protein
LPLLGIEPRRSADCAIAPVSLLLLDKAVLYVSHAFMVRSTSHRFIIHFNGLRLSPLGTAATIGLLYQPQMIDDGDCGAVGGMKIGRGTRSTRRKPATLSTINLT